MCAINERHLAQYGFPPPRNAACYGSVITILLCVWLLELSSDTCKIVVGFLLVPGFFSNAGFDILCGIFYGFRFAVQDHRKSLNR